VESKTDDQQFKDYARLPDMPEDKAECFYCPRVLDKNKMRQMKMRNSTVWVCDKC